MKIQVKFHLNQVLILLIMPYQLKVWYLYIRVNILFFIEATAYLLKETHLFFNFKKLQIPV
jgi:hypothetical protein